MVVSLKRWIASRKGFELQFNWIFVLIAGAVFMGFFFLVIRNQLNSAEMDDSSSAQSDLGFILRTSQGSRSSEKVVPLAGDFSFECVDGVSSFISSGSQVSEQYNYLSVFSPERLDAREVIIRTDTFRAPFSIMPFSYLSNRETEYVFVNDDLQSRQLFFGLPENASRKFLTGVLSNLADSNYDSTLIIANASSEGSVIAQTMSFFKPTRQSAISLVIIDPEGGIPGLYGKVRFYSYSSSGFALEGEAFYFTQEQLLGAVYSGSRDIYQCQFDKSFKRLNLMADFHMRRALYLKGQFSAYADCSILYSDIMGDLDDIKTSTSSSTMTYVQAQAVFEASSRIAASNAKLEDVTSCSPIY